MGLSTLGALKNSDHIRPKLQYTLRQHQDGMLVD